MPCNGSGRHRWARREAHAGLTGKDVSLGALYLLLQLPTRRLAEAHKRGLRLALARQTRE